MVFPSDPKNEKKIKQIQAVLEGCTLLLRKCHRWAQVRSSLILNNEANFFINSLIR